jgi:phosphatidate cytidylyltransferase
MSETARRILSAAILVPAFLFCFYYTGWFYIQLYLFCSGAVYIGIKEFYRFADRGDDGKPFGRIGILYGLILYTIFFLQFLQVQTHNPLPDNIRLFLNTYVPHNANILLPIIMVMFIHIYILQILTRQLDGAIFSTSATISGVIYLSVPSGYFLKIVSLENGIYYIWIVAGLTFLTDTGAYFGGRWFGRHPAGLKISPKKTWEGYITGLITALIYTLAVNLVWEKVTGKPGSFGYLELVFITPVLSLISVAGDLAESAMKRDAKMKDSAGTIPGHGGLLDLCDAIFFTVPVAYFYLSIKQALGVMI